MSVRLWRAAMLSVVGILPVAIPADAQEIPPDTVTTLFVTDTIQDFGAVGGVVTDKLGFVYIADFRNAVWRLDANGRVIKYADGFYGASGNAIGPRGYLYQSSFHGNYVARVTRTGHWEVYADEGLSGPVGIAAAPNGDLFVVNCSANSVARIDTERRVTEFSRSDLFTCPNGITFDDRGDLFVVNFNNTKVVKVTADGLATEFVDIPGAGGNGHITFAKGALYVTKFRGNQVFRVTRDGSFSVLAGTGQPGEADGPALQATLTRPNGIAASPSGGELYVNDFTVGQGLGVGVNSVTVRRIKLMSLTDVLATLAPDASVDDIRTMYEAYHDFRDQEDTTTDSGTLGFAWMSAGRVAEGVALHELSAERFPESVVAQFNCGEAYRYTGQPQKAAEKYRRVLELQPDHAAARNRLALVGG